MINASFGEIVGIVESIESANAVPTVPITHPKTDHLVNYS